MRKERDTLINEHKLDQAMPRNVKLIAYPVSDIAKVKAFYRQFLDVEPYVESSFYVGYRIDDLEVGLDPNAKLGPIAYADYNDIKSSIQAMLQAGAEVARDVRHVGRGLLTAQLKDVQGNVVGLRQQS
ncbi:MAG TPA: hypothetical protein VEB88_05220 [Candidatus Acidoferrales bacterium]|nr:hypothetical protein [Candidatus Acidoferrales bacterium]